MYKIADSTKDNTTIIPVTENFEPVEIVTQPTAKNLLNFKTLKSAKGVSVDIENLTLTTDGSVESKALTWTDGENVAKLQLSHHVTMRCVAKILEDCTVQSGELDLRVYDNTKRRSIAWAGNTAKSGTVYVAGQEVSTARMIPATTLYEEGDNITFNVHVPKLTDGTYAKVEFSRIMISLEGIPYEPYPDCEVLFAPETIEAEGTEIAVDNTYSDTLEAKFFGKSKLKFDVAQCQGNTTQEAHEASANLFNFDMISAGRVVTIDRENLTLTTDGSAGFKALAWMDGEKVAKLHLTHSITMKCTAKILEGCTVKSGNFDLRIYDDTKYKSLAWAGGYAKVGTVYTTGQEILMSNSVPATTLYEDGHHITFNVFVPEISDGTYMKVEFSNIMVSLSSVPYEPYREKTPTLLNPSPITPHSSGNGKFQINHANKKYEIQLPCDLHGFTWDDIEYRDVLKIDFLRKRYELRKTVGTYVLPASKTFNQADWLRGVKRITGYFSPAKKAEDKTIGHCAFAEVKAFLQSRNADWISPYLENYYWYPDITSWGLSDDATIEEANEHLNKILNALSDEERTITYALAEEIVIHGDITEVETSTLPELPLEATEITEQSFDCPAVIEPVAGTVTAAGLNIIKCEDAISQKFVAKKGSLTGSGWGELVFDNEWVLTHLKPNKKYYSRMTITMHKSVAGKKLQSYNAGMQLYRYANPSAENYISPFCGLLRKKLENGESEDVRSTFTTPDDLTGIQVFAYTERYTDEDNRNEYCANMAFSNIMLSEVDAPYTPHFHGASAALPSLHGLEQLDSATEFDYIDQNGKKIVSDYVMKVREKADGVFVDKIYKTVKYNITTLDGNDDERWIYDDRHFFTMRFPSAVHLTDNSVKNAFACTHFKYNIALWGNTSISHGFVASAKVMFFRNLDCADLDAWKAFLAAQATAGTPVKIIYKLAEPIVTDITDTAEGQAILQLKTIPYCTRLHSDYHACAKFRTWNSTADLTSS